MLLPLQDTMGLTCSRTADARRTTIPFVAAALQGDPLVRCRCRGLPHMRRIETAGSVRHRLADLFLDTLPYNAHTTASDALWIGLPVVTSAGQLFAGRVPLEDHLALQSNGSELWLFGDNEEWRGEPADELPEEGCVFCCFNNNDGRSRPRCSASGCDCLQMWEIWQRGEQPRSFPTRQSQQC